MINEKKMTSCPICYDDKKLSHSCSNSKCDKHICNDCYNNWIVEMENKNCVAEYIPCPTWMYDSERNIKQWLKNPILRPSNRGTIFCINGLYNEI